MNEVAAIGVWVINFIKDQYTSYSLLGHHQFFSRVVLTREVGARHVFPPPPPCEA